MNVNTKEGMAAAVAWQQKLIDTIQEGGTWAIPRSGTLITFHKDSKVAVIAEGLFPEPTIKRVLTHMGWTIRRAS
jgi:hypothetical protein